MTTAAPTTLPTLEASGYPLAYRSRAGQARAEPPAAAPAAVATHLTVEAATLDGMQKEGFVTAGRASSGWRLPTDESTQLRGRDAAPQPLALHNAAVQACVLAQLLALAEARGIEVQTSVAFDSHFNLKGSFFRGDVKSSVVGMVLRMRLQGDLADDEAVQLARQAVLASPSIAALLTPLDNTFGIRLNGEPVALPAGLQSGLGGVSDPAERLARARAGGPVGTLARPVLSKEAEARVQPARAGEIPVGLLPDIDRSIHVRGEGHANAGQLAAGAAPLAVRTSFFHPLGSVFSYRADLPAVDPAGSAAPAPLAYLAASIAFCFMTQFHRYAEVHRLALEGLRVVQLAPFVQTGSAADGTLAGQALPVDTHIFVDAGFAAERCEDMLRMAHRTCFLHVALAGAQRLILAVELNGREIAGAADFTPAAAAAFV